METNAQHLPTFDTYSDITAEAFEAAVNILAAERGIASLLSIPGVFELVQEELNNDALDLLAPDADS